MVYYYPHLNLDDMSMRDFAFWSENAYWLHSQMLMMQQANAMSIFGGVKK